MVRPGCVIVIGVSKKGFCWILAERYVGEPGSQDILWVKASVFVVCLLTFVVCLLFCCLLSLSYVSQNRFWWIYVVEADSISQHITQLYQLYCPCPAITERDKNGIKSELPPRKISHCKGIPEIERFVS